MINITNRMIFEDRLDVLIDDKILRKKLVLSDIPRLSKFVNDMVKYRKDALVDMNKQKKYYIEDNELNEYEDQYQVFLGMTAYEEEPFDLAFTLPPELEFLRG